MKDKIYKIVICPQNWVIGFHFFLRKPEFDTFVHLWEKGERFVTATILMGFVGIDPDKIMFWYTGEFDDDDRERLAELD